MIYLIEETSIFLIFLIILIILEYIYYTFTIFKMTKRFKRILFQHDRSRQTFVKNINILK